MEQPSKSNEQEVVEQKKIIIFFEKKADIMVESFKQPPYQYSNVYLLRGGVMEDLTIKGLELLSKSFQFIGDQFSSTGQQNEGRKIFWLELSSSLLYLFAATGTFYLVIRRFLRRKMLEILVDPIAFWNKKPSRKQVKKYRKNIENSIPIVAIADFKGGTGKSMIAANLAASFDEEGARVLLLDLGHNVTLSRMMPIDKKSGGFSYSAHHVLKGTRGYFKPEKLLGSFRTSFIYPAMEDLREDDSKLAFRRLIGAVKKDIRFNVHDYLSQDSVQNQFDIIIIDMPARLTTTATNALCACTHVLIPTVLDMATLPVTIDTLAAIRDFRKSLKLKFRFLGVVPSMVGRITGYGPYEQAVLDALKQELAIKFDNLLIPGTKMPEALETLDNDYIASRVALRHEPGQDLPYFTMALADKGMFLNLRDNIKYQLTKQHKMPRYDIIAPAPTPAINTREPAIAAATPAQSAATTNAIANYIDHPVPNEARKAS